MTAQSPIGAHTFIWSPQWDPPGAHAAATQAASAGYDFIEIPLLDPSIVDIAGTVRLLDELGLGRTCSLGLPVHAHLPGAPEEALAFLTGAVDVAAELGSRWLTGALYGSLGTLTGTAPTADEIESVVRILRRVAAHAAGRNVRLGLELINRYETYLLNTAAQAADLIDRIDAPNVFAHLDTFHANIEEDSLAKAVDTLGHRLGYVHLAESHRGAIGDAHVPFDEMFTALGLIGYRGPLVVEGFMNADPVITAATAGWRDHLLDPQQFATDSLTYFTTLRDAHLT